LRGPRLEGNCRLYFLFQRIGVEGPVMPDEWPAFCAAEIELGRRLFAGEWNFIGAAETLDGLPRSDGLEIAFAGRSNVGKSSLINAVTGRRALARTSKTPGRTQQLLFFRSQQPLTLVDMPGYGYAASGKAKAVAWSHLIGDYLQTRANLGRIYVLIDARHGLKSTDQDILDTLSRVAVSHQIVLTKCDEVGEAALAERCKDITAAVAKRPAAFPQLIATSARSGRGIDELRSAIARLVEERAAGGKLQDL
jgi:GTP-binding protein